jgi:hypothetical protein
VACLRYARWQYINSLTNEYLHIAENQNRNRVLVKKRPLGRPGCRWEDNIKMNLKWR